jgi:hypothetical protein
MASVYRQLVDVEKERYKDSLPFIDAYNKGKGVIAFEKMKEKYDRKEMRILDDSFARRPVLGDMISDTEYLGELQKKYGSLTWISGSSKKQKELNAELNEILGMRPLAPSYIPIFGAVYRKSVGRKRMEFIRKIAQSAYCGREGWLQDGLQ